MEWKSLTKGKTFTFLCVLSCACFTTLHATEAPVIEVVGGITNASIVSFQNGTHIVVSRNVTTLVLTCNASYPVMWELESLEQPWAAGTRSDRIVGDFKDKSTYKYSMSVTLINHNGYPYSSQLSLEPEKYECKAADKSNDMSSKMTIIWEGKYGYWNIKHNQFVNGSYQVYWKENQPGESSEILIPCYTFNMKETTVELYKRELNKTVQFLASDNGTRTPAVRFEKYVGFFLKSSSVQSEKETYECHRFFPGPRTSGSRSKRSYLEEEYYAESGEGHSSTTKSPGTGGLKNSEESDEEYKYIESEEQLLGKNATIETNSTQTVNVNDTLVPGSISVVSFLLIKLNASTYKDEIHLTKKLDTSSDTLSTYLNRNNPNLTLTHTDTSVSCCIKPEFNSSYTSDHMVLYHKWCTEPLMCLTTKHLLKKTYILYYAKYDSVQSTKCRSVNTVGEYSTSFAANPALYVCHMRTDRQITRYGYNGDYDLKLNLNNSENSYFLKVDNRSTFTTLQYYNQTGYSYLSDISNVTFFDGETAQFRCHGNGFFYAGGNIWELQWKNGTTDIRYAPTSMAYSYYSNYNMMKVNLTDSLEKISCHIPVWNSSDWVTRSFSIKVQASRPPTSPSGESSSVEEIEFYAGQSKVLNCDLQGHPAATYKWSLSSSVYSFLERTPVYYSSYTYYTRRPSYPSSYREPTTPKVTVSLYAPSYVETSTLLIPEESFICTATNLVGNGTKVFKVRGKRTVVPEIGHGNREITVLFLHDEQKSLNCTVRRGMPFPEFYWQKHDMNISSESEHYDITVIGNSSILTFKSVEYEDEGDYKCIAFNFAGRGFRDFNVRVRERPHSRYWYEFAIFLLTLVLIILFGSLAYVYVSKSKKINSLKLRAEYSNLFGRHESRITVATLDE